jgi:hypothetical protein
MSRPRVIQLWFSLVAVLYAAWATLGTGLTVGNTAMLFAISLVPVGVVMMLWPVAQPQTAGQVLRGE